ncbi:MULTISPECIES: hypothetical protein [Streptomyces]|uniref:hypothetical protein n=1 Tax=Streptomyces TaxID=1883 RepID=UPI0036AE60A2
MVAGGTAVLGAASYIHLAVAGHSLATADMAGVSVLWTLVMSVRGEGAAPVLRKAGLLTAGVLAVVLGALAVFAGPIADRLFRLARHRRRDAADPARRRAAPQRRTGPRRATRRGLRSAGDRHPPAVRFHDPAA